MSEDFWTGKSDLEIARLINLGLLMVQGISDHDAGFDMITGMNDAGIAKVADIVSKVRAADRERCGAAREFVIRHPALTLIDLAEFDSFLKMGDAIAGAVGSSPQRGE